MKARVRIPSKEIDSFCRRWRITELALFGSVMRDDFRSDSDVDVLVKFDPETRYTLFDLVHMQEELRTIFGRDVDLVEKTAIERSRNPLRRKAILETAEIVYAA
ncbi:MAG: nucleotidyltransferase [Deltaproteobacteria bacterium HGW-Deltaproteobacteria-21]|nr:MAG: nucleotidyltransferase [Deltaproteobacteria bacterium HGW-Deltaproteobacteria-21]